MIKSSFKLIKDDIVSHVADQLDAHKHITGEILVVNQIPHNPQGKKLRDWSKFKNKIIKKKRVLSYILSMSVGGGMISDFQNCIILLIISF